MEAPTKDRLETAIRKRAAKGKRPVTQAGAFEDEAERARLFFGKVVDPVLESVQQETRQAGMDLELRDVAPGVERAGFRHLRCLLFPPESGDQPDAQRPAILVGWREGGSISVWCRKDD